MKGESLTYSTVNSSEVDGGQRILTVQQYGPKTANECAPFGDDSCPVPNLTAIYAETGNDGDQVIIGYINLNQLAAAGEKRFYSVGPDGTVATYLWLKSDGTTQFGGTGDNLVRYAALNTALQAAITALNAQLAAIAVGIAAAGGEYTPEDVTLNITGAKITAAKCSVTG